MKQLLLIAGSLLIIGSLSLYYTGKKNYENLTTGQEEIYSYQNECIGLSDIKRLYVADTNQEKRSFFRRISLQTIKANITCNISKTILQNYGDSLLVAFKVIEPQVTIENNQGVQDTHVAKEEITHPSLVTYFRNGTIKTLRIDTSISVLSASLIKEMLGRFQFAMQPRGTWDWTMREANNSGEFIAGYHFVGGTKDGFEYEKTNKGYNNNLVTHHEQLLPEGKTIIYTDSIHNIEQENISETLTTLVGRDTVSVSGSKIKIRLVSKSLVTVEAMSQLNQLTRLANYEKFSKPGEKLSDEEIQQMAYRNTLGNDNWESLTRMLDTMKNPNNNDKESLTLKFRALASLFPEECRRIGTVLEKEAYGTLAFEILGNALSRSETKTATDVIAKVIQARRDDEDVMIEFLPVLATTTAPTDDAVSVTRQLGFETVANPNIVSTAQLALGGIAYNFRLLDKQKAISITQYLMDKMQNTRDSIQQILVLGNTGSVAILPVIESYITNPGVSKEVRARSISALRLIDNDKADAILNGFKNNNDSLIINAVKETALFRQNNK